MNGNTTQIGQPSQSWVLFSYLSFGVAVVAIAAGVAMLGENWWIRGYFAIAAVLLVQSCFSLAKTLRDIHESGIFINRIEDAKTERLLRDHAG